MLIFKFLYNIKIVSSYNCEYNMIFRQVFRCYCNLFCQYKYNTKLEALINRQIQLEEQAAKDYLGMAVFFRHPSIARPGTGGFFMNMYEEEIGHMLTFVNYQLLRGGNVEVRATKEPPKFTALSMCEAFQKGLNMEKEITKMLDEVVKLAEELKDYQCADYVTSVFLAEQMKSINEFSNLLTKISRLKNDEHALYQYDLHLLTSHPYNSNIKLQT